MNTKMHESVERICDVLVHTIDLDLETMADVSDWFSQLSQLAVQAHQGQMASVTQAAALVLEKKMVDESREISQACLLSSARQLGAYGGERNEADDRDIIKQLLVRELAKTGYS